jgi:hypothetical protein
MSARGQVERADSSEMFRKTLYSSFCGFFFIHILQPEKDLWGSRRYRYRYRWELVNKFDLIQSFRHEDDCGCSLPLSTRFEQRTTRYCVFCSAEYLIQSGYIESFSAARKRVLLFKATDPLTLPLTSSLLPDCTLPGVLTPAEGWFFLYSKTNFFTHKFYLSVLWIRIGFNADPNPETEL